ncbi:hypothetical protein EON63_03540 [archaeon]|nr:MAG: hypothetical protein EON63_03540 [archaeon]
MGLTSSGLHVNHHTMHHKYTIYHTPYIIHHTRIGLHVDIQVSLVISPHCAGDGGPGALEAQDPLHITTRQLAAGVGV